MAHADFFRTRRLNEPSNEGAETNGKERDDAVLAQLAQGGDANAFGQLVIRHERKLIQTLARLVHDWESARDLAQETFWRAYNRLAQFDSSRPFGPWLYRIGVNLSLDWLRKQSSTTTFSTNGYFGHDEVGLPQDYEPVDPDPREREDLAQEVQFLLSKIPVAYRTILVLRDLEGFSSAEIAAIINRRETTVRWRLCKAREMFRELWERRQQPHHHGLSPMTSEFEGAELDPDEKPDSD